MLVFVKVQADHQFAPNLLSAISEDKVQSGMGGKG
jgi:hypothetical protein